MHFVIAYTLSLSAGHSLSLPSEQLLQAPRLAETGNQLLSTSSLRAQESLFIQSACASPLSVSIPSSTLCLWPPFSY